MTGLKVSAEYFADDLARIAVDRRGEAEQAFMTTVQVRGGVEGEERYTIGPTGLSLASADLISASPAPQGIVPPQACFQGRWLHAAGAVANENNILGQNGRFEVMADRLEVPAVPATPEYLAYYGARLIGFGEAFSFETQIPLPVTTMAIGADYVPGFIMDPKKGGGVYLEHHNLPHFHMPLSQEAGGYLLLGKQGPLGDYELSAFCIPYGFGVYTGPYVLHDDAFLVGDYEVVYGVAPEFSTVTLYQGDSERFLPLVVNKGD